MRARQKAALGAWQDLPKERREEVLWNLRADVESWECDGEEEYPNERALRAMATKLAILALGGDL